MLAATIHSQAAVISNSWWSGHATVMSAYTTKMSTMLIFQPFVHSQAESHPPVTVFFFPPLQSVYMTLAVLAYVRGTSVTSAEITGFRKLPCSVRICLLLFPVHDVGSEWMSGWFRTQCSPQCYPEIPKKKKLPTKFVTFGHITFGRAPRVLSILTRPLYSQRPIATEGADQTSWNEGWVSAQTVVQTLCH